MGHKETYGISKEEIDQSIEEKIEEINNKCGDQDLQETRRQIMIYGIRYVHGTDFLSPYPGIRLTNSESKTESK